MIIDIAPQSDFSIHNLPFGIFSTPGTPPRVGMAIGTYIIDLSAAGKLGLFDFDTGVFEQPTLNEFISLGKDTSSKVRKDIRKWLEADASPLVNSKGVFISQASAQMHMPIHVGDYTDFYSSIEHATNVGKMFRDPENALLPNWKHVPVGYHGRASSIVVSGENIRRPKGQVLPKGASSPVFQASSRLDFELEMAFIIGKDSSLGTSISTSEASDYIFGLVLFNDWSARDIQKWEYVPLGPFLGKNFASSISPWVVPLEALEPFKVAGPTQEPKVLPYLEYEGLHNYDIQLSVGITPKNGEEVIVSRSNYKYMYWNMVQQLAHHTINGCNVKVGDLLASGTISGNTPDSYGSMLELSWAGTQPIPMKDGSTRTFLQDGDRVSMRGHAEKEGIRVGFGEVTAQILPSI
ncbi:MAG: fumarylacetoacetase [Bacteroidota bacterium]